MLVAMSQSTNMKNIITTIIGRFVSSSTIGRRMTQMEMRVKKNKYTPRFIKKKFEVKRMKMKFWEEGIYSQNFGDSAVVSCC